MVVVATLTLILMIATTGCAGLLRGAWSRNDGSDLRGRVLALRRIGIVVIMLLAGPTAACCRQRGSWPTSARCRSPRFATLVPAAGVRRVAAADTAARGHCRRTAGSRRGLGVAGATDAGGARASAGLAVEWPFGLALLSPDGLFGLTGWSRLAARWAPAWFVGFAGGLCLVAVAAAHPHRARRGLDAKSLRDAGLRFLPGDRVRAAAVRCAGKRRGAGAGGRASSASSRRCWARPPRACCWMPRVASRCTSTRWPRSRRSPRRPALQPARTRGALQNMSQASRGGRRLRLCHGTGATPSCSAIPRTAAGRQPIAELSMWAMRRLPNAGRSRRRAGAAAGLHARRHAPPVRTGAGDGAIIEIRGNPCPARGFVATFTDVTAFRRAEAGLIEAKRDARTTRRRAHDRPGSRQPRRRACQPPRAASSPRSDTTSSAAAARAAQSHRCAGPAARRSARGAKGAARAQPRETVAQISGALDSRPTCCRPARHVATGGRGLGAADPRTAADGGAGAAGLPSLVHRAARGLRFRFVPAARGRAATRRCCAAAADFLANAVRVHRPWWCAAGRSREGDGLRIEVHDTGPGIAPEQQTLIFEEFPAWRGRRRGRAWGWACRSPTASPSCCTHHCDCAVDRARHGVLGARCAREAATG